MLCRNFELIPIKFGFLKKFKAAQKLGQRPCTIVQGLQPNLKFHQKWLGENSPLFSDTYTCIRKYVYMYTYVDMYTYL